MLVGGPEGGVTLQLARCVYRFHPSLSVSGPMPHIALQHK